MFTLDMIWQIFFFDQGKKILAGQDFTLSDNYKFYFVNNAAISDKEIKTSIQIKEFEELSFSFSQFCEKVKNENSKYICDASKPTYETGIIDKPKLWYYSGEQGFAVIVVIVRSPEKGSNRDLFMTHLDLQKKEITKIKKLPGDMSFGLDYANEGDLNKENIRWYTDIQGHLFRIDFASMEAEENKSCGDKFSSIYSEQSAEMDAEKKRTGKDLIRMPFLRLTPFISADEKYALLFDYSDIDDGDPINKIGFAYYCEIATGKLEKFPGQHTVYAATMSIPGKIIYYTNQRGEYYSLDIATKKLSQVLKGKNMGDSMVIFEDSAIVHDDDFTWIEARKLANLKQVKSYSLLSMEKLKNQYSNRIVVNPTSSSLIFFVYENKDYDKPSRAKFFLYKMSIK